MSVIGNEARLVAALEAATDGGSSPIPPLSSDEASAYLELHPDCCFIERKGGPFETGPSLSFCRGIRTVRIDIPGPQPPAVPRPLHYHALVAVDKCGTVTDIYPMLN